MDNVILIESNQELAKRNHLIDYGTIINEETSSQIFSNNVWRTKLPSSINLDVGDSIQYYSSMIKSKGLSNSGVELIGSANSNQLLVDNKMRLDIGFYIQNNWLNNLMLPKGLASLKDIPLEFNDITDLTLRNFDFINTYNTYHVPYKTATVYRNIPGVWYSDYGGPSVETAIEWFNNGPESLTIQADEIENVTDFKFKNTNPSTTSNLKHYTPDETRLYVGPTDWLGPYQNGNTGYHNEPYKSVPYSRLFEIVKTEADIEVGLGFNSPVVIAQKITEDLNDPDFTSNQFVKPQLINYKSELPEDSSITNYKNYFKTYNTTQVIDETQKAFPTSFGKRLYDINNGVDNFALNDTIKAKTGGTLADIEQRSRYMWNSIGSGDFKRTEAMSKLYQNLSKSVNAVDLPYLTANLNLFSVYTGNIAPNTHWASHNPEGDSGYPTTIPYNFGEQMVIAQDLLGFAVPFNETNKQELKNRVMYRDITAGATGYNQYTRKPNVDPSNTAASDQYLNLAENRVIMTNLIANDMNFEMLKTVIEDLELPSSDTIEINYKSQEFLDSLYFSFELGRVDDMHTDSIFNILNTTDTTFNVVSFNLPRVEAGIPVLTSLPCCSNVGSVVHPVLAADIGNDKTIKTGYNEFRGFYGLPLYAGLFANEDNIKFHSEVIDGSKKLITQIEEFRSNKMYQFDFFSRYNSNRTPSSGNLVLPQTQDQTVDDGNFFFQKDGEYFNDSKIKELGLGCVVAYTKITAPTVEGAHSFIPFIGFVCRQQISSKDLYNIPLPSKGEFFGIPRSLNNNSLSYTNSWERKVDYDPDGTVLIEIKVTKIGEYTGPGGDLLARFSSIIKGTKPQVTLNINKTGSDQRIFGVTVVSSGADIVGTLKLEIHNESGTITSWVQEPEFEIITGSYRTSYKRGPQENSSSNFPYIMMGANDLTSNFDETQSRMSFTKMHTLVQEGQQTNNLQRYYDGNDAFNTPSPLILADTSSATEVLKLNVRKTYCNSSRAGFTEGIPISDLTFQKLPINNNAIRSQGISSALSGIGIVNVYTGMKNGSYLKVNPNNEFTFNGSLFDKLGFSINQLIPKFGTQNRFFNRGTHNKYVDTTTKSLSMLNNSVYPLTTNAFVSATLNQSINTNNLNMVMGSLDGQNLLEKSIGQTSDSVIAEFLPTKFSYSHILVNSNIISKHNYIAGQSINKTPVIGAVNRSYAEGDFVYGNAPGEAYIVDKNYILSEVDINLTTELGEPAPIDSGSTVIIRIIKRKPVPLNDEQLNEIFKKKK
tara:strand:+ start:3097 stop:6909 length:3813 start_codon:yes stop_codon:yes gene_type:complete